jgi:hypothetical protein
MLLRRLDVAAGLRIFVTARGRQSGRQLQVLLVQCKDRLKTALSRSALILEDYTTGILLCSVSRRDKLPASHACPCPEDAMIRILTAEMKRLVGTSRVLTPPLLRTNEETICSPQLAIMMFQAGQLEEAEGDHMNLLSHAGCNPCRIFSFSALYLLLASSALQTSTSVYQRRWAVDDR